MVPCLPALQHDVNFNHPRLASDAVHCLAPASLGEMQERRRVQERRPPSQEQDPLQRHRVVLARSIKSLRDEAAALSEQIFSVMRRKRRTELYGQLQQLSCALDDVVERLDRLPLGRGECAVVRHLAAADAFTAGHAATMHKHRLVVWRSLVGRFMGRWSVVQLPDSCPSLSCLVAFRQRPVSRCTANPCCHVAPLSATRAEYPGTESLRKSRRQVIATIQARCMQAYARKCKGVVVFRKRIRPHGMYGKASSPSFLPSLFLSIQSFFFSNQEELADLDAFLRDVRGVRGAVGRLNQLLDALREAHEEFRCPVLLDVMRRPVRVASGTGRARAGMA